MKVYHRVIKIIEFYFAKFYLVKEEAEFEVLIGFIVSNENHVHKPKFKQSVVDLLALISMHLLCESS